MYILQQVCRYLPLGRPVLLLSSQASVSFHLTSDLSHQPWTLKHAAAVLPSDKGVTPKAVVVEDAAAGAGVVMLNMKLDEAAEIEGAGVTKITVRRTAMQRMSIATTQQRIRRFLQLQC